MDSMQALNHLNNRRISTPLPAMLRIYWHRKLPAINALQPYSHTGLYLAISNRPPPNFPAISPCPESGHAEK
jgi:hypothetical protein